VRGLLAIAAECAAGMAMAQNGKTRVFQT